MKYHLRRIACLSLSLGLWQSAFAATVDSPLGKVKSEAQSKGYIFYTSHEQIVSEAKKEGKLKLLTGLDPQSIKAMTSAFKRKYPFINVIAEEAQGITEHQRIILELKAGLNKDTDGISMASDLYNDYMPYLKKFDILSMAEHGVLQISPKLIDPVNRYVVAIQSNMQVIAYNKEMISGDKVPDSWEGFLAPEFKGKKFLLDVRPKPLAALVPLWGLEKTVEFAKKLAAQQPIWYRGESRQLTQMTAGEHPVILGPNYKSAKATRDPRGILEIKVVEPVPARFSEVQAVLNAAANPHAGLLWLEFQASAEGQKILDDTDLAATIYTPGSVHEKLTRNKKVSLLTWDKYPKMGKYEEEIIKAYGFPRAEAK